MVNEAVYTAIIEIDMNSVLDPTVGEMYMNDPELQVKTCIL